MRNELTDAQQLVSTLPQVDSGLLASGHDRFLAAKIVSIVRAASDLRIDGDWVEFGVARGTTANLMLDLLPFSSRLHLFDSFTGLPRDWLGQWKAGHFALSERDVPAFDDSRVLLNKGLFSETVPDYFDSSRPVALIHIDCDLYESTLEALSGITPAIRAGTIVLFDEYYMTSGGETADDEHRALIRWTKDSGVNFRYLWRTAWRQVAVEITNVRDSCDEPDCI